MFPTFSWDECRGFGLVAKTELMSEWKMKFFNHSVIKYYFIFMSSFSIIISTISIIRSNVMKRRGIKELLCQIIFNNKHFYLLLLKSSCNFLRYGAAPAHDTNFDQNSTCRTGGIRQLNLGIWHSSASCHWIAPRAFEAWRRERQPETSTSCWLCK